MRSHLQSHAARQRMLACARGGYADQNISLWGQGFVCPNCVFNGGINFDDVASDLPQT
jgi:hypothetical protein